MIEKVARVIHPGAWRTLDTAFDSNTQQLERLNSMDRAKAAIEAMLEPTDGMMKTFYDDNMIKQDYKNMVQAALEGK